MVVAPNKQWSKCNVGLNLPYKEYITKVWLNVNLGIFKAFLGWITVWIIQLYTTMTFAFHYDR